MSIFKIDGALYPLIEQLDAQREHFLTKKQEIKEVVSLLMDRVEAEKEYSRRLLAISESFEAIRIGILGQEIEAFKGDCRSKGKAAEELAENVESDCVQPITKLLDKQDAEYKAIIMEFRKKFNELTEFNN